MALIETKVQHMVTPTFLTDTMLAGVTPLQPPCFPPTPQLQTVAGAFEAEGWNTHGRHSRPRGSKQVDSSAGFLKKNDETQEGLIKRQIKPFVIAMTQPVRDGRGSNYRFPPFATRICAILQWSLLDNFLIPMGYVQYKALFCWRKNQTIRFEGCI